MKVGPKSSLRPFLHRALHIMNVFAYTVFNCTSVTPKLHQPKTTINLLEFYLFTFGGYPPINK